MEPSDVHPVNIPQQAHTVAPVLWLDANEPFAPVCVNVTHTATPDNPDERTYEYTVMWTGDIGHIHETETVWVTATPNNHVTRVAGTSHGAIHTIHSPSDPPMVTQPDVLCEPGKHAAGNPAGGATRFHLPENLVNWWCGPGAGMDGVHHWNPEHPSTAPLGTVRTATRHLQRHAFTPAWEFTRPVNLRNIPWVTETQLADRLHDNIRLQTREAGKPLPQTATVHTPQPPQGSLPWTLNGEPFTRTLQKHLNVTPELAGNTPNPNRIVINVGDATREHVQQLWEDAWETYTTSLTIVVGTPHAARHALHAGFRAATTPQPHEHPNPDFPWIYLPAPGPHHQGLVDEWRAHRFTIGPANTDVTFA